LGRWAIGTLKLDLYTVARGSGWKLAVLEQRSRHDNAHLSRVDPGNVQRLATLEPSDAATQAWLGIGFSENDVLPPRRWIISGLKLGEHLDHELTIGRWKRTNALDARITTGEESDRDSQKRVFHGLFDTSNENKMSDGGRDRASLEVKMWKSSQNVDPERSGVRSIAWLDDLRCML
jgi:hypothetical protein